MTLKLLVYLIKQFILCQQFFHEVKNFIFFLLGNSEQLKKYDNNSKILGDQNKVNIEGNIFMVSSMMEFQRSNNNDSSKN